MIRKAEFTDINEIMGIKREVVGIMHKMGNRQWGEAYPLEDHFRKDIIEGNLYVYDETGVEGFIAINRDRPKEYETVRFEGNGPCYVIHRMAVSVNSQGKGIGSKLIDYAIDLSIKANYTRLITDTNSKNIPANRLFISKGFVFRGIVNFRDVKAPFHCYELIDF